MIVWPSVLNSRLRGYLACLAGSSISPTIGASSSESSDHLIPLKPMSEISLRAIWAGNSSRQISLAEGILFSATYFATYSTTASIWVLFDLNPVVVDSSSKVCRLPSKSTNAIGGTFWLGSFEYGLYGAPDQNDCISSYTSPSPTLTNARPGLVMKAASGCEGPSISLLAEELATLRHHLNFKLSSVAGLITPSGFWVMRMIKNPNALPLLVSSSITCPKSGYAFLNWANSSITIKSTGSFSLTFPA